MELLYTEKLGFMEVDGEVSEGTIIYLTDENASVKVKKVNKEYGWQVEDRVNGEEMKGLLTNAVDFSVEDLKKEVLNLDNVGLYGDELEVKESSNESEKVNYDYEVSGKLLKYGKKLSMGQKIYVNGKLYAIEKVGKAEVYVSKEEQEAYEAKLALADEDKKNRVKKPKGKKKAKVVALKEVGAVEGELVNGVYVREGKEDTFKGFYKYEDALKEVSKLRGEGLKGHL